MRKPEKRKVFITVRICKNWEEKKEILFKEKIHKNIKSLIAEGKDEKIYTSPAIFKPTEILDLKIKPVGRKWDAEKLQQIEQNLKQLDLLDFDKNTHEIPQLVNKLPYEFSYAFKDKTGNESTLMIEDWEIGALYWKCFKREKDEQKAIEKDIQHSDKLIFRLEKKLTSSITTFHIKGEQSMGFSFPARLILCMEPKLSFGFQKNQCPQSLVCSRLRSTTLKDRIKQKFLPLHAIHVSDYGKIKLLSGS